MMARTSGGLHQKIFCSMVQVAITNSCSLKARTLTVSSRGLIIMSPAPIERGALCNINFAILLNGEPRKVNAVVRILDTICIGMQGFRTGLHFVDIDDGSRDTIHALIAH